MPLDKTQQILVEDNMGLVSAVIKENIHGINSLGTLSYDDIYQIGCIGLIKAVQRFTPGPGKFSTYAYSSIRNEIFNSLNQATRLRKYEFAVDPDTMFGMNTAHYDQSYRPEELVRVLEPIRERTTGIVAKGIYAIQMYDKGYSYREIGDAMGVEINHVTAWVSKARKYLKTCPEIAAGRGAA